MTNQDIYLYLDLNGRLDHNFFLKENIYFKVVNLTSGQPLVQIGNYVFQGAYEDFLGTKVFFVEDKDYESNHNVFVKETPIHLKYLAKTAKTLQLKWRKIPTNIVHVNTNECTDLQFTEDYKKVIEKFEKGALNLKDIIYDSSREEILQKPKSIPKEPNTPVSEVKKEINDKDSKQHKENTSLKSDTYELLKELAKTPAKSQEKLKAYEIKKDQLAKVENAENFIVLKQLFLQNLTLKNQDAFKEDKNEFNKYVDIEKSLKDGVIKSVENKEISDEDKQLLLSGKNFDNFSLPMQLAYLTEQLEEYKRILKEGEWDKSADEYGRTFKERYRLLKGVTKDVWYHVYSNCDYLL